MMNKKNNKNAFDKMGAKTFTASEIDDAKDLATKISGMVKNSISFQTSTLLSQYEKNLKQYYRKALPNDDKLKFRSKHVTSDVQERVDIAKGKIVRTFDSQKEVVSFAPLTSDPMKKAIAKQQNSVIKHVLREKNSHVAILSPWIMSGSLFGLGVLHISFEAIPELGKIQVRKGVNDEELVELTTRQKKGEIKIEAHSDDYKVEIPDELRQQLMAVAQQQGFSPEQMEEQAALMLPDVRDIAFREVKRRPNFYFKPVPVEDFIVSKEAIFDPHTGGVDARLQGHRSYESKADLIERGYDKDILDEIVVAADKGDGVSTVRGTKIGETTALSEFGDEIEIFEIYTKIAIDGSERLNYRITLAGNIQTAPVVLGYEEVSKFYPYAVFVPFQTDGTIFGQGFADRVGPEQELSTRVTRAYIDNMHFQSDPVKAVNTDVTNGDDALNIFPGKQIRTSDPSGGIAFITPPSIGGVVMPFLDLISKRQDAVSGVGANMISTDIADKQDVTATAVLEQKQAQELLIEQVCRSFADTGYRYGAKLIIDQCVQKPELAQEYLSALLGSGEALTIDRWDADMDVSTNITFGMMDRTYKNQVLMQFLQIQQNAMATTPVVSAQNIHSTLVDIAENFGIMDVGAKVTDPSTLPPPPPAPDPNAGFIEIEKVKAELKNQQEAQKREFEAYKLRVDNDLKRDEMIQNLRLEIAKLYGQYRVDVDVATIEAEQNKQRSDVDWAISQNEADARRKQEEAERQQQIQAQIDQAAALQAQVTQQQQMPPMPPQI
jgi:hypothetical protein